MSLSGICARSRRNGRRACRIKYSCQLPVVSCQLSGGDGVARLSAVEEESPEGEQGHQSEPGDEGAAAERVFLLLNQGERAADEE